MNAANPRGYVFTTDWLSRKVGVWEKTLAPLKGKPDLNYLEVGVWEGRSLTWMLDNVLTDPSSRATAVDIFPKDLRQRFLENVAKAGASERVTTITGPSQVELKRLAASSFDLIYVDGSHMSDGVIEDAVLAWDLLKVGGILIFDDYEWKLGRARELSPRVAIDSFLMCYGNSMRVLHLDAQVLVQKIENPCAKHNQGKAMRYCSPIGGSLYYWNENKLFDAATFDPIEIAPEEARLIQRLLLTRKIRSDRFYPDQAVRRKPAFDRLVKKLKLEDHQLENQQLETATVPLGQKS